MGRITPYAVIAESFKGPMMSLACHCFAAFTLTVVMASSPVFAAGYYNMPTELPQCLGLGYGPGYHAPLLLSRSYKAKTATQRVRRLPAPLPPQQSSCFGTVSSWDSPCETGSCGGHYGAGTIMEGATPVFAPPMPQQAIVRQPPVTERNYPAPSGRPPFPSAKKTQKPLLLW